MTLPPGSTIGKYVVRRKLAEGGMAEIYLCHQRGPAGFEKEAVIKRVRPFLAVDPGFVEMFIAEARVASRLNHPNIVHIFDFDQHEDTYFLAMEYVRGSSLLDARRRAHEAMLRMSPTLIAHIGAEVAKGLHYAHRLSDRGQPLGLVHRDVSPHNVLLSVDGAVKLADFGIAKAGNHMTAPGMLKGKFAYMAPEQARGEDIDARTDVFALGIVLWELLTGGKLFTGDSDVAVLRAVQHSVIAPPSRLNPDVPEELSDLVMKALERDADARYTTAEAFGWALANFALRNSKSIAETSVADFLRQLPRNADEDADDGVPHAPASADSGARLVKASTEVLQRRPVIAAGAFDATHIPPGSTPAPVEAPSTGGGTAVLPGREARAKARAAIETGGESGSSGSSGQVSNGANPTGPPPRMSGTSNPVGGGSRSGSFAPHGSAAHRSEGLAEGPSWRSVSGGNGLSASGVPDINSGAEGVPWSAVSGEGSGSSGSSSGAERFSLDLAGAPAGVRVDGAARSTSAGGWPKWVVWSGVVMFVLLASIGSALVLGRGKATEGTKPALAEPVPAGVAAAPPTGSPSATVPDEAASAVAVDADSGAAREPSTAAVNEPEPSDASPARKPLGSRKTTTATEIDAPASTDEEVAPAAGDSDEAVTFDGTVQGDDTSSRNGSRRRGKGDIRLAAAGARTPAGMAVIVVKARPWADLSLQGRNEGTLVGVRRYFVQPGTYRIVFRHQNRRIDKDVTLKAGETAEREFNAARP